jgi:YwiC-like protein
MSTSQIEMGVASSSHSRVRHLVWPREHGAWGMLFVPLATGAALGLVAGGSAWPVVLLVVAAFSLFCLRTCVESLWGTSVHKVRTHEERDAVTRYLVGFATVATTCVAGLFALGAGIGLLVVGAGAAAAFALQLAIRFRYPQARMAAQVAGAVGLTATAAAAYCIVTGHLDARAIALWAANWIFAGNQIHFVQARLHSARLTTFKEKFQRASVFFDGQFAMMAALSLAWGLGVLPVLVVAAFTPVFIRGMLWFFNGPQRLSVKRLGFMELAHSIAFGGLLVVAFR